MNNKLFKFWKRRRDRFYRRHKWQIVLDFSLIIIIIILIAIFIRLVSFKPILNNFVKWPTLSSTTLVIDDQILSFDIIVSLDEKTIAVNENISWKIQFKNNGEKNINQAYLDFIFPDHTFLIDELSSDNKDLLIKNNQIIINNVQAGKTIDFNVELKWHKNQIHASRSIKSNLKASVISDDGHKLEKMLVLEEVKIIADLKLKAELFYHSLQGDQLGIGPIPPEVGIATKYWLIIKVDNLDNQINNFIFSTQLAENVELSDDYSLLAGKFSYDKDRRLLIWKIDQLGFEENDYVANFALYLTPTKNQLGKNVEILKNINYYADDPWSGTTISAHLNNLDSSLPADKINKGQGIVISNENAY